MLIIGNSGGCISRHSQDLRVQASLDWTSALLQPLGSLQAVHSCTQQ